MDIEPFEPLNDFFSNHHKIQSTLPYLSIQDTEDLKEMRDPVLALTANPLNHPKFSNDTQTLCDTSSFSVCP